MARINSKGTRVAQVHSTHEGAPAKRITDVQQLRRTLMACLLWEDTFYEEGESVAARLASYAVSLPWHDVAAAAVEARTVHGLRHAPMFLLVSALQRPAAERPTWEETFVACCTRADDLTESLAMYWKNGRKPIAASFKRGLAEAFKKFDHYALSKYNRDNAIKLRDVLRIAHPKADTPEQGALWKSIIDGSIASPDTWEVALSGGADKGETFTRLLSEQKLGALALVRNLRNMLQANVSRDLITQALDAMKVQRVWPYQFIAAAKHAPLLEPALERAMLRSLQELPKLRGRTVLVVDRSGSMNSPLSSRSQLRRMEAAAGLAILLREVCEECTVLQFDDHVDVVPARRGFALRDALGQPRGGTYTERAKAQADALGYERIIIITDEQSAQPLSKPKGKGYVLNISTERNGIGYGAWQHIDGWSEHVVRYLLALEQGDVVQAAEGHTDA